jgi:hypothetical protein
LRTRTDANGVELLEKKVATKTRSKEEDMTNMFQASEMTAAASHGTLTARRSLEGENCWIRKRILVFVLASDALCRLLARSCKAIAAKITTRVPTKAAARNSGRCSGGQNFCCEPLASALRMQLRETTRLPGIGELLLPNVTSPDAVAPLPSRRLSEKLSLAAKVEVAL